ncbi:MAG: DUF3373 domain-containing protein [Geobacteraceae bacterium]|nr:DUF3373 domain-containing protein [Geobacteraceae bacterium]
MRKKFGKILMVTMLLAVAAPLSAYSADEELLRRIDALSQELNALKQQVKDSDTKLQQTENKVKETEDRSKDTERKVAKVERNSLGKWLTISGDYRFRYDYLHAKAAPYFQLNPGNTQANGSDLFLQMPGQTLRSDALYTNRFGLNVHAQATQDVSVTARLLMYKTAGAQDDAAIQSSTGGSFFADRSGLFDGTIGHVPGDSRLAVDRVYATWKNIAGQPIWFSIGRRPSTGGVPSHLRQNNEKPGNAGVPSLMVDYAFDGVTLGWAPDIAGLDGAYAKFCYGRGFQDSINSDSTSNGLHSTDMLGVNIAPYDTDLLKAEFQYNRGMNIFNSPNMLTGQSAGDGPVEDLGDIDWYGISLLGKVKNVGIGNVNWFASGAISQTHPNGNTVKVQLETPIAGYTDANGMLDTGAGLLYTGTPKSSTGWAVFVGGRYDIEQTGTKLGFEYNHGSKDWITFAPAADDMWTSKVGTRGNVYEFYIIQELKLKPISSYLSKTFFRIGYQYYDFEYTGSNNWVGAPVKISDVNNQQNGQFLTPLKNAQDLYATFEVHF